MVPGVPRTPHKVLLAQVSAAVEEAQLPLSPLSVKPCQAGRWAGEVGVNKFTTSLVVSL